ncbi:MAG TPA: ABC transporter permease [candidate division Zixibacteria bacterium]|nr:ABC transporter permease [candidate division Zixibacteria bacterium]
MQESRVLEPPGPAHWMGTDGLGRDLFTRVLYGARVSVAVGVGAALVALLLGTAYGTIAGFAGGRTEEWMMRMADVIYGLPDLLLFILLSLVLGRNVAGLLLALGLVSWVRFARVAHGQVLQAKELAFIEGARAIGAPAARILWRHLLPNVAGPLIVTLTFSVPAAILAESTLSFIGLGINDPYSAWGTSWGGLAQDGWRAMRSYPHVIFFPAAAIFLTILSFNALGNALGDWLDPGKTDARIPLSGSRLEIRRAEANPGTRSPDGRPEGSR